MISIVYIVSLIDRGKKGEMGKFLVKSPNLF
jgi:hypothetical protein